MLGYSLIVFWLLTHTYMHRGISKLLSDTLIMLIRIVNRSSKKFLNKHTQKSSQKSMLDARAMNADTSDR